MFQAELMEMLVATHVISMANWLSQTNPKVATYPGIAKFTKLLTGADTNIKKNPRTRTQEKCLDGNGKKFGGIMWTQLLPLNIFSTPDHHGF
ncbi:hypothetical protein HYALB_00001832 [Hymenoscyphus albidus]|uniref:Uncharacterized protein n=1 Tax=Hymenoscyphus albidus TaxID=595503 RepID=A0A9N9LSS0_9HELO|nr:hypothetical protein HYALB_00001832 [Hymenoscyphus albidus]